MNINDLIRGNTSHKSILSSSYLISTLLIVLFAVDFVLFIIIFLGVYLTIGSL